MSTLLEARSRSGVVWCWLRDAGRARDGLVLLTLAALYPTFVWIARRAVDGSDEPWGMLSLVAVLVLVAHRRYRSLRDNSQPSTPFGLWAPAGMLLPYVASYHLLTPLPRGMLAATAVALLLSRCYFGCRLQFGLWGLLLLSLPLVASLQFYLGYPLRYVVAQLAAILVQLNGFSVQPDGVGLRWGDQLVLVDAPCSGIKMLWAGGFLTSLLVCLEGLRPFRAMLAFSGVAALVVIANVLRATSLFYVETEQTDLPPLFHTAMGLTVFVGVLVAALAIVRALRGREPCKD